MEDLSASADHSGKTTLTAHGHRIVAAVNEQETRWFLDQATPEKEFGFSLSNQGRRAGAPSVEEIQAANPEVLLTCWSTPFLPEEWLASPECRLRYVCHLTGSVRHVVSRQFIERGGLVTNWGSIPSATVAEQALLLALAALRNLPHWAEVFAQPENVSTRMERLQVRTLFGRRVGIHGFGQVARALVKLLAPFGVTITAYSEGVPSELFAWAGVKRAADLHEVFADSDVVFECEALTPRTQKTVGAAELAALRDGGIFVNVARAGLVDEDALLNEARARRIGVALDVFATEPLPPTSPWLRLPGVVTSPHIAGPTFDQYAICANVAFANVGRYLRKQPLEFLVTPEIYDRST